MIGKEIDGRYTRNLVVTKYIKFGCMIVATISILLSILSLATNNTWILGWSATVMIISILTYIFFDKIFKFKAVRCTLIIKSIKNGTMILIIKIKNKEDIETYSNQGTWDRDTLIMEIIDYNGSRVEFGATKNDYKLLRQDDVNIEVIAHA